MAMDYQTETYITAETTPPQDEQFLTYCFSEFELDEACRRQQLGEGWFPALEDVKVPIETLHAGPNELIHRTRMIAGTDPCLLKLGPPRDNCLTIILEKINTLIIENDVFQP